MDREQNHSDIPRAALTREDRLAAKLRENLRRRKSQARALQEPRKDEAESHSATLSKPSPES